MCVSCGCGKLHDNHGDPRHLTLDDLEQAADAAGLSVDQVVKNIQTSTHQAVTKSSSSRQRSEGPESI